MPIIENSIRSLAAGLTTAAILIAMLVLGKDLLLPFALGAVIAFILEPLVRKMTEYRVPRGIAAILIVGVTLCGVATVSFAFSSQLVVLTASLSNYKDNLVHKLRAVAGVPGRSGILERAAQSVDALDRAFRSEFNQANATNAPPVAAAAPAQSSSILDKLAMAVSPVTTGGLALLFTIFLLVQYHDIRDRIVRIAGTDNISITVAALSDAGERLSRLFLMQAILNTSFGVVIGIVLAIMGVPNALLWGVATAILRFIPFIGGILAAVPPIFLAAAVDPGWSMAIATLLLYVLGEMTMANVVEPLVLGRSAGLSPFALVLSASFWTLVWGPVGLLLAAPLTMSIVLLGQYLPNLEFMTILLGDSPPLTPDEEFYHRLLSADASAAFAQFKDERESTSATKASESIVMPALRLASRDQRAGKLDVHQLETLRTTMFDVAELIAETEEAEEGSRAEHEPEASPVVILPARGPVDEIASHFLKMLLNSRTPGGIVALEKGSGLMGVSSLKASLQETHPSSIILVTTNKADAAFVDHIQRRVSREFPNAQLVTATFKDANGLGDHLGELSEANRIVRSATVSELAGLILNSFKSSAASTSDPVDHPRDRRESSVFAGTELKELRSS